MTTQERKAIDAHIAAGMEQGRLFPRIMCRVYKDMETPTNQWIEQDTSLPTICLELRASLSGAADPWPDPFMEEVVKMLELRLATWLHRDREDTTDTLVRLMVEDAVKSGRRRLEDARRDGSWWEGWKDAPTEGESDDQLDRS
jgi:hypothetical protein